MQEKNNKGFTLTEMMIGIALLLLIGSAVLSFQRDIFVFNRKIQNSLLSQEEARRALSNMTSDIRIASPSSLGAYPISTAATSTFTFFANIDSDPLKERVRYFLDGNVLKKGIIKPSGNPLSYIAANETVTELVNYVANGNVPVFNYYGSDYDGFSSPLSEPLNNSSIRLIKIIIMVDRNPSEDPGPSIVTTQITMRNLKENL